MTNTIPKGLLEHSKQRSLAVIKRLNGAQKIIEAEIEANEGIYPYNGGRVSQAELCRRAKVSQVSLSTKAHKDTTRKTVEEWLIRVRIRSISGCKSVRKTVTNRADEWKRHHDAIAENYRLAELEMLDMRDKLKKMQEDYSALLELIEQKDYGKIVLFQRKKDT